MLLLLAVESDALLGYCALILISLIIWFQLLRWAVRANDVVKNQELIIHMMVQQFKKQGATEEELKKLKEEFESR